MKAIFATTVITASLLTSLTAMAVDMPPSAKKNNCTACHAIDKKLVGPSWMDVSHKYKEATKITLDGKDYPLEQGLMMKVSKGGKGNWGAMPMPANDAAGTKQADIKELVKFILGLAK